MKTADSSEEKQSSHAAIVSSDVRPHRFVVTRSLLVVIVGALIILIALGGVGYLLWHAHSKRAQTGADNMTTQKTVPGNIIPVPSDPIDAAYQAADALQFQGKYSDAKKTMDDAISKAGNDQDKARGYTDAATIAINQKAYQNALGYAKQADAILKTADSAALVAQSAEGAGDKTLAIEYYTKAIGLLHPAADDENAQAQLKGYRDNLAELQR